MIFKRQLFNDLVKWKATDNRKPLILRGARQVGKTTLVKEFSKKYKQHIFLNLEKAADLLFFEEYDDVQTIIDALFLSKNKSIIEIKNTLLFIDEIQESPKAIQLLRYFYEEIPQLHVIAAGSLLEFAMGQVQSFPVGRVEYLYLHPLNFFEFLNAIGHTSALEQLQNVPIKTFAHKVVIDLFHTYAIIGGMPEIVKEYIKNNSYATLSKTYESIWTTYKNDVEKYTANDTGKKIIKHIMATAHLYLDQRVKFQNFGNSNYKSREVSEAMHNLNDAKIIQLIYPTTVVSPPIIPDIKKSPRLQFLDTGIINFTLGIQAELLALKDLSTAYKGALIPHLFTQEILSLNSEINQKPNFWVREKKQSSSEIDLLYNYQNKLIPIEIKSGKVGTLKSLHQFMEVAPHQYAVRVYGGEFSIESHKLTNGKEFLLLNLPYYLATQIEKYLDYFVNNMY